MKSSYRSLAPWVVLALATLAFERPPARGQDSDPLKESGAFQRLAAPMNKLLELRWENDRMRLVRDENPDRLELAFREIQEQAGTRSSGSSSGGDNRSLRFEGSSLKGELELSRMARGRAGVFRLRGDLAGAWPVMRLMLREVAAPGRHLTVHDDGDGALSITLASDSSDHWLRFRQRTNGSVLIQEIRGEELFAAQADSLMALVAKQPKHMEEKFMPLLKHVGFVPPLMPSDPRVQAAVLSMLRPSDAGDADEFTRLIAQLADPAFQTREQATRTLAARYERYKPLLVKAAADKSLAPEAQQRIKKLLQTADKSPTTGLDRLIEARGLIKDPEYLVLLLASAKVEDERALLVAHLEKLSGQKLGGDVAAWRKWLEQRTPSSR
jgi:hypothetical protein